eukprot:1405785-Amphidinium_carterae.1
MAPRSFKMTARRCACVGSLFLKQSRSFLWQDILFEAPRRKAAAKAKAAIATMVIAVHVMPCAC